MQLLTAFRFCVFIIATSYWVYLFFRFGLDPIGAQFKFLTNWCLTLNMIVAFKLWKKSLVVIESNLDPILNVTVIVNMVVLALYWRLYLQDPSLVNASGGNEWYLEYYLHGLGPGLMIIDALFIEGAFKTFLKGQKYLMVFFIAYLFWIELIVSPLNEFPVGHATTGFPYPFLNNLILLDRGSFYFSSILLGLVLYMILYFSNFYLRTLRGISKL